MTYIVRRLSDGAWIYVSYETWKEASKTYTYEGEPCDLLDIMEHTRKAWLEENNKISKRVEEWRETHDTKCELCEYLGYVCSGRAKDLSEMPCETFSATSTRKLEDIIHHL